MRKEIKHIQPITSEIKTLIEQSRQNVAFAVNTKITFLYWKIGTHNNVEVLVNERAEYWKQIVYALNIQSELTKQNDLDLLENEQ